MSKELFLKVRHLSEKKRKNEEAVPMELLNTKYRVPYENLCTELKENRQKLRMIFVESIRVVSGFAAEACYMDLSDSHEWEMLLRKYEEECRSADTLTKELLKAFILTINGYVYEEQSKD